MKNHSKTSLAVVLAATVMMGASALADDIFHRTVNLAPNMAGHITISDLGVGDEVHLNLVNSTDQALTFRTSQMLGPEQQITVPANSSHDLQFTYNTPWSDDVNFVVTDTAGAQVASGILFDVDGMADDQELGEDVFRENLTLSTGMDKITFEDLGVGDTVMLTLNNPTSEDLWFEVDNGDVSTDRWLVPANSQREVSYEYNLFLNDDIRYTVSRASDNTRLSSGGFYIPTAEEQSSAGMTTPSTSENTAVQDMQTVETRQSVRGFW